MFLDWIIHPIQMPTNCVTYILLTIYYQYGHFPELEQTIQTTLTSRELLWASISEKTKKNDLTFSRNPFLTKDSYNFQIFSDAFSPCVKVVIMVKDGWKWMEVDRIDVVSRNGWQIMQLDENEWKWIKWM